MDHFSGCKADVDVVEHAARHGRLETLRYFLEYERQGDEGVETRNVICWGVDDLVNALEGGFTETARWLYENTPEADRDLSRAMRFAVRRGDMEVIRWLLDVVYRPELHLPPPTMNDAAAGGHMEILQWIFEQGYEGESDQALEEAARDGCLDMVEWLVSRGITEGASKAAQAASNEGHLSILRWLREHNLGQFAPYAMSNAIYQGHLDIVEYLNEEGISDLPSKMMKIAAGNAHLDIVKWLYEEYDNDDLFPPYDPLTDNRDMSKQTAMDEAAINGHLHVLEYLHAIAVSNKESGENGGPTCSKSPFNIAAAVGHFEVVKWLYQNYPEKCFSHRTTTVATMSGKLEIMQWLHDQTDVEWTTTVMDQAAEGGHLHIVKWLHVNRSEGCTEYAMNHAANMGHLNVVRWLNDNRSEGCTAEAMDLAAGLEHFEVLLYLRARRTEGSTMVAKLNSLDSRRKHQLAWLEEHYPDPMWG
ncbi:unnamed protein product [Phytophthora fragariaefolia]|uniref:Unnamed protein product n=1 Tax=Phytophthora fragariaefolia TaxID=1490495 RepID=A0A9W6TKJ3_9STRA|nr:unnamed protein product [Phytophthora fragariaefolia]